MAQQNAATDPQRDDAAQLAIFCEGFERIEAQNAAKRGERIGQEVQVDPAVDAGRGFVRVLSGEDGWKELGTEGLVHLRVGQLVRFNSEAQSCSVGSNVVTEPGALGKLLEIDSDGDLRVSSLRNLSVADLYGGELQQWFRKADVLQKMSSRLEEP